MLSIANAHEDDIRRGWLKEFIDKHLSCKEKKPQRKRKHDDDDEKDDEDERNLCKILVKYRSELIRTKITLELFTL